MPYTRSFADEVQVSTRSHHKGFTKLEVCVVICIITLLVVLLLPTIGILREQSRSQSCKNNLFQIVSATLSYAAHYDYQLPGIATLRWRGVSGHQRGGWTWHAALLPHLKEESLYNSINWSFGPDDGHVNRTVLQSHVDVFLCPSDHGGRNSYAVNAGTWYDYDYATTGQGRWDGFTAHHKLVVETFKAIDLGHLADGTARSVIFAEQVHLPSVSGMGPKPFQMFMDPGVELRTLTPLKARQVCLARRDGESPSARYIHHTIGQSGKPASAAGSGASIFPAVGQYWATVMPNRGTFVNGLLTQNSKNCLGRYPESRNGKDAAFGLRCASSWHKRGVNIAIADGSVRFLNDDIDPDFCAAVFSIDRGESQVFNNY